MSASVTATSTDATDATDAVNESESGAGYAPDGPKDGSANPGETVGWGSPAGPSAEAGHSPVRLHMPEEPILLRQRWCDAIGGGAGSEAVIFGDGGLTDWLWSRWTVVEQRGVDRGRFESVVRGCRREFWLWLAGERPWEDCCASVIGRIDRRFPD
jgi:hypothetical protein